MPAAGVPIRPRAWHDAHRPIVPLLPVPTHAMTDHRILPLPAPGPATVVRILAKRGRADVAGMLPMELRSSYLLDRIDAAAVDRYRAALGFAGDAVPLTWWYLPVQRAHMGTLLRDAFPFRLAGMIHAENTLTEHRAADRARPVRLDTVIRIAAPAPNGAVYCALETRCLQDGEPVVTCASRYLARRGARREGRLPAKDTAAIDAPQVAAWHLDAAAGRRYAAVSGDWNPIHLWGWSARLFGLPAPIIHGMQTVGRACAAIESVRGAHVTAIGCRFRAPLALGSDVVLHAGADGSFAACSGGRLAVEGNFAVAAGADQSARPR